MHPGGPACTRLAVVAARARGARGVSSSGAYRVRRTFFAESLKSDSTWPHALRGVARAPPTVTVAWFSTVPRGGAVTDDSNDPLLVAGAERGAGQHRHAKRRTLSPRASVRSRGPRPTSGRIRRLAKYSPCIPGIIGDLRDLCSIQLHAHAHRLCPRGVGTAHNPTRR